MLGKILPNTLSDLLRDVNSLALPITQNSRYPVILDQSNVKFHLMFVGCILVEFLYVKSINSYLTLFCKNFCFRLKLSG